MHQWLGVRARFQPFDGLPMERRSNREWRFLPWYKRIGVFFTRGQPPSKYTRCKLFFARRKIGQMYECRCVVSTWKGFFCRPSAKSSSADVSRLPDRQNKNLRLLRNVCQRWKTKRSPSQWNCREEYLVECVEDRSLWFSISTAQERGLERPG